MLAVCCVLCVLWAVPAAAAVCVWGGYRPVGVNTCWAGECIVTVTVSGS